jgi:serine protease Do
VAAASPSVVQIETETAQGSGVIISADGLIMTNEHVVAGATAIIVLTQEGRRAVAAVQAADATADIALLKINLEGLPAAMLGAVATVAPGIDVVAIGSPMGLTQTVSRGVLSSIRVLNGRRVIQTDAAVSPGSSGGPLLNDRAEVIGIVSFKLSDPLVEGLNFALAIDDALSTVGVSR